MIHTTRRTSNVLCALLILTSCNLICSAQHNQPELHTPASSTDLERLRRFARELEQLRTLLKIPGMSAAILRDHKLIWAQGFGFSDYENKILATPETPYEIGSVTKPIAATVLMQLVEQGKASLDDPMSKYSSDYKDDLIQVRHVLTHTSEGEVPGETYEYNGNLFDNLTDVVIKASGKRFRLVLAENILQKLGMTMTSPGNDYDGNTPAMNALLGEANVTNYAEVLKRLAKPYRLYGAGEIIQTYNPRRGIGAANGIISTVTDLAIFDAAVDQNLLVRKETQEKMWTAAITSSGKTLPYGFGWMVQRDRGLKLIWHNGYLPDLYSAMMLKVPEKGITLILLANSDAISAPVKLGKGNIMNSAFANSFIRTFVFEDEQRVSLPAPTWGLKPEDFRRQSQRFEKHANGYKYESEMHANEAIRQWLDIRRSEAHKSIKVNPKIYDAYVGEYQIGTNASFRIINEAGHLIRQGRSRIELFPESSDRFFAKAVDAQFTFVKDDAGKVVQLKISQGENEILAQKRP